MTIKKVAVIGAGTMGAGIAGQAANAGCDVMLLDLPSNGDNVNAIAQKGLDRISHPGNPGVLSPAHAAGSNHLHGGGDLLRGLNRADLVFDLFADGHLFS